MFKRTDMVIIEDSRYTSAFQEERLKIPDTNQLFKKTDLIITKDSPYTSAVHADKTWSL
jgi:hypothetical protein